MEHQRYNCIGGVCPRRDFRKPLERETRAEDLIVVLHTTYTGLKGLPGYSVSADGQEYYDAQRSIDCDEVYPGVFIGDGQTACNKQYLCNRIRVTHVLNAAEGKSFGYVNTDAKYYIDTGIEYMGCHMIDAPSTNISQYFYPAADFIDNAVRKGGKRSIDRRYTAYSLNFFSHYTIRIYRKGVRALRAGRVAQRHPRRGLPDDQEGDAGQRGVAHGDARPQHTAQQRLPETAGRPRQQPEKIAIVKRSSRRSAAHDDA
ncbi:unnamed protein product [Trichogramma brassicae]|uniref:Uncharacterized protein n=1 Tax=Trichogramma brassicae TaxID=86971 RepID=A0A6H5HYM4_9HYME|nr:unnamed protein product [Trichogramma brassicae]